MQSYRTYRNEHTPTLPLDQLWVLVKRYWFQLLLILFALHLFFTKEISIQVDVHTPGSMETRSIETERPLARKTALGVVPSRSKEEISTDQFGLGSVGFLSQKPKGEKTASGHMEKLAERYGNLSFILNPGLAQRKGVPDEVVEAKLEVCRKYVERFAQVAVVEREKYGVPVSIKLAQGLLETNAGSSKLVSESRNHFGIKCKSRCGGCTCRNYADDDKYDMFRVFDTAWESYREHSLLLQSSRYRHLKKLDVSDYKNWAHGLKKAGYATDPNYAEKLIHIIEALDLHQFDRNA